MSKIKSDRTQLSSVVRGDAVPVVDVSDTTDGAAGTLKWATVEDAIAGPWLLVAANDAPTRAKKHADYVCDGTDDEVQIQAALDALPSNGGTVRLSEGTFVLNTTTISVGEKQNLIGSGRFSTILDVNGTHDAITVASGVAQTFAKARLADFAMELPLSNSGDGIVLVQGQSSHSSIERVSFTGGSSEAWCINSPGINVCKFDAIEATIRCNGINLWVGGDVDTNFGDSLIIHCDISLTVNGTTGIRIAGGETSTFATRKMNNMLLARNEITGTGIGGTCVGFHLRNSSRITCIVLDLENLGTGILNEGAQDGGPSNTNNTFINVTPLSVGTHYSEVGTHLETTILGGDGDYVDLQRLPGDLRVDGTMKVTSLPTSDPSDAGALWNDNGTVKVSAG